MQTDRISVVRRWAGDSERWATAFLKMAPSDKSLVCIVAMGSAVRDRGHRRSDLDLLLLYRGKRPAIAAPLEVDIRPVAIEKLDERIARGHEILCWALKFGAALHDPECYWARLHEAWSERLPLPSAKDAEQRAEQALAQAVEMLQIGDESAAEDLLLSALTQFARERLIKNGVFPASRPELPIQLRKIHPHDPVANMLEDAMYGNATPGDLLGRLKFSGGIVPTICDSDLIAPSAG